MVGRIKTKVCRACGQEKPATEYYGHPGTIDRLSASCGDCMRAYARAYGTANREAKREYHRQWLARRRMESHVT